MKLAIRCVRDWLGGSPDTKGQTIPGADYIFARYRAFRRQLPRLCKALKLDHAALEFVDYATIVAGWLKANPK